MRSAAQNMQSGSMSWVCRSPLEIRFGTTPKTKHFCHGKMSAGRPEFSRQGDSTTIRKRQQKKYCLIHQIIPKKSIGIFRTSSISHSCQINTILVMLFLYIQQVHQTVMGVDVECGLSLPAWETIPFVFPHPSHKHLVFMRKEPVQSECHDNLNFCHTSC